MFPNRPEPLVPNLARRVLAAVVMCLFLVQTTGCSHIGQAKPADVIRRPVPILGVVTEKGGRYMFDPPGWIVRDTVFGPVKVQDQSGVSDTTYTFPLENVHRVFVRQEGMSGGAEVGILLALVVGAAVACFSQDGYLC